MSTTPFKTGKKTKVQQHFKNETSITNIVNRFTQAGQPLVGQDPQAQYFDHTNVEDYTTMLNQVTEVKQRFAQFSSKIRSRFRNDPANLLAFMGDDKNLDEAIELGLARPTPKADKDRAGAPAPKDDPKPSSAPEEPQIDLVDESQKPGDS